MGAEHAELAPAMALPGAALGPCTACGGAEDSGDLVRAFPQVALGGVSEGFASTIEACPWQGAQLYVPSLSWPGRSLPSKSPTANLVRKASWHCLKQGAFSPFHAYLLNSRGRQSKMKWVAVRSSVSKRWQIAFMPWTLFRLRLCDLSCRLSFGVWRHLIVNI